MSSSGIENYGADATRQGVVTPATITHAGVQAALTAASPAQCVIAGGSYTTNQTLVITGNCDLSRLTINYTGTGAAVQIGSNSSVMFQLSMAAPKVINTNKTAAGWSQVTGSIGYDLVNLNSCPSIKLPFAQSFGIGMQTRGAGQGFAYNTIVVGQIDNNQINHNIVSDNSGWCNQNLFLGGRYSYQSTEGTNVVGTRQVRLQSSTYTPNNNTWVGASFEGNTPEYHLESTGTSNVWLNCRWEATTPKINWTSGGLRNLVMWGYNSDTITETYQTGASENRVISLRLWKVNAAPGNAPIVWMENQSASTYPVWSITNAGDLVKNVNPATSYTFQCTAQLLSGKKSTDTYDRVRIDSQNGALWLGDGTVATPQYSLKAYGGLGLAYDGGPIRFTTSNTYDIGVSGAVPRYVRAGTALQTGAAVTASRPAAATAGAGAMFYDTTLSKPIWSDGTTWRDATGAAV